MCLSSYILNIYHLLPFTVNIYSVCHWLPDCPLSRSRTCALCLSLPHTVRLFCSHASVNAVCRLRLILAALTIVTIGNYRIPQNGWKVLPLSANVIDPPASSSSSFAHLPGPISSHQLWHCQLRLLLLHRVWNIGKISSFEEDYRADRPMVQRASSSDAPSIQGGQHRESRFGLGYTSYQSGYNKLFTQVKSTFWWFIFIDNTLIV